jgi:lipopolysaccharide transport system permease protein
MSQTALSPQPDSETLVIRPTKGWASLNLRELWQYRELIYFLTWRDIKVRYKQTILGAAWAIINPVINMVVLQLVFGQLAHLGSEGVPGPIFRFAALLPWGLFSKALTASGRSMLSNRSLITKVYFPRLSVPLASTLGGVLDFLISFAVLLGMMLWWHVTPNWGILTLPFIILFALITALGVGLWFSALNVLYRDVGYILPVMTQLLLFISPVGYSTSEVPIQWQALYALNPMTGVIESFRWAILGTTPSDSLSLGVIVGISAAVAVTLFISGLFYFRRMERSFADVV